ncbi:MAG: ATPase [Bacteroidota bacterium]
MANSSYTITKSYAQNLKNKVTRFKEETQTNKTVFLTFLTTFGVKDNAHKMSIVQDELTMDALFDKV